MCGFIAQLLEQRTGSAEVTGSNPVEALIFFFQAPSKRERAARNFASNSARRNCQFTFS